jgi:GTP-binding protein HflX
MERAISVTVDLGKRTSWTAKERAAELGELARSAGAKIVKEEIVRLHQIQPAYYIGSGKAAELAKACADYRAGLVIFNNDLSGSQQKNLEEVLRTKTIDRTQLILDIFAARAHTNDGKIQVELAQLMYLMPRLTGKGIYLSRLGGGIGTRGPGEQKLEIDRRRIRERITRLRCELEDLSRRRAMMRKKRERFSLLTISIIGYTNVGKSTLLNTLTNSGVVVEDRLFSTLDPTVRKFMLPNRQKVLFIDTVGFLEALPHHLVEAFRATLEEVAESDLIVHLVDISHPKAKEQSDAACRVLKEIGASGIPVLTVLNKTDRLENPAAIAKAAQEFAAVAAISALRREGFNALIDVVMKRIGGLMTKVSLDIPASDASRLSLIHENGLVTKTEYTDDRVRIEAELPTRLVPKLNL